MATNPLLSNNRNETQRDWRNGRGILPNGRFPTR